MPAGQLLVAFATNCTVAVLSAVGVRWFIKDPPWFGTLRNVSIYLAVTAGISPALSALGGAFVQILGGGPLENYWTYWGYWYLSNALGSVTLGPVFLIWFGRQAKAESLSGRRKAEAIILALSLGTVCAVAFHPGTATVSTGFLPALLYSPLPLMLWAAIRFGERGASGAILVVTVVSIWQSLHEGTVFIGIDRERNVLALQVFLMGLSVALFFLGAAIDELQRAGEAMRGLAGALLRAQDEERRRIARELHDSTGQNLVVAGLIVGRMQTMTPASCTPVIAELTDVLQRSIQEIRTVSYLLHPPLLDGTGLNMALRSYLDGFSKRTRINVNLDISPEIVRLPSSVELVLFRVIQEALTNVWRHSGSAEARIQLALQASGAGPRITLSVEDDGKGIPQNIRQSILAKPRNQRQLPVGLGLAGMRERLHQIGGSLQIDSATGKTVIRAIVTLNPQKPNYTAYQDVS
jgi:signal transduction histidine kinase